MPTIQLSTRRNAIKIRAKGPRGLPGLGVPAGGTTGQVLAKDSNTDYDTGWTDITGVVTSVNGESGIVVLDKSDIGLGNVTNDAQLKASNLDTDVTLVANSDTKVASQKATKTYVDTQIIAGTPDATSLVKGKIQLSNDLGGTASSPTVVATHLTAPLPVSQGGTGATTDLSARTSLGLTIGSDVQAFDSDLTSIANLSPLNDNIIQRKSGAWAHRTPAQLKVDLALLSSDVGLGNVPNVDATLRSNHTGTQLASTISDLSEAVDDRVGSLLIEGIGIDLTYDDTANTLTIASTVSSYTDEQAQDAVGTILTDSNTIDQTYNDAGNTISADVRTQMSLTSDSSGIKLSGDVSLPGNSRYYGTDGAGTKGYFTLPASSVTSVNGQTGVVVLDTDDVQEGITNLYYTDERVSDSVGSMVTGNTEIGITVTYQDADNTLDFAVTDSPLLNSQNAAFYLARANHTGTQLASSISDFDTQVRTNRLDQMAAPTANVSLNSHKLVSVTDPTSDQDAATKAYVDSVAQGLIVKDSVHVATTGDITLSGEQTIDGVLTSASRVLVKDQTDGSENGIYVSSGGAWNRSTDADTGAELTAGTFTFVSEGSTNASSGWVQTTTGTITLGTTVIMFSQFSGAGQIIAGAALVKTGNTLDVVAGTGITVAGDNVAVDSTVYRQGSTDVAIADGGTGASSASSARTNLGVVIGTDVQAFDATLSALASYNTNGIITQTNTDTFVGRTITTGSSKVTIIDGDGVAGDPTIDISEANISRNSLGGGALTIANGGTGQTTAGAAFNALSPLTTLGDILYRDGSGGVRLAGNITATKNFLTQTGNGSISSAPAWGTIVANDVPNLESLNTSGGLTILKGGTGATTASGARTNLGLIIGTDVQAFDPELAALAGLTSSADKLPYFTGSGTASLADLTSTARSLLDDTTIAAMRTTLSAQRQMVYDVRDYGAVFDGTTDDKAAIQAALDAANAAGGGIVEMPIGTAKYSGVMTLYSNITLRGQGMLVTKLQTTATSGALPGGAAFQTGSTDDYINIEGFEVVGHGETQTSGTGIYMPGGVHSFIRIREVYVHGFPNHGIHVVDPILSSFEDLWTRDCGQDGIFIDIGTSCFFKSIYSTGCNRSGFHLRTHTYAHFSNCAAEYTTFGYWLESTNNVVMNGCGGEVQMRADGGSAGLVAHVRLQSANNITINSQYSTKFAYLNGVPAYHYYITGSKRVKLSGVRGKAPLGGDDPGEAPTNTIYIDSTSEVTGENVTFEAETGGGINGSFANEIFSEGEYTEITSTNTDTVEGKSYIANNSSTVTFNIPAIARVGKTLQIVGRGSGGWKIAHGAGKVIHFGDTDTNTTLGGRVESTHRRDTLKLVCTVANNEWTVASSIGNLSIVDSTETTFGKSSDGANSSTSSIVKMIVSAATPASNGIVSKGTARVWMTAGSTSAKFVIYADSVGSPGAKLAESDAVTISNTSEAPNDFPFSGSNLISVPSGTPYWVGVAWNAPSGGLLTYSRDTTASGHKEQEGFTWPTLPTPFGTPSGTFTGTIDAYVTYNTT